MSETCDQCGSYRNPARFAGAWFPNGHPWAKPLEAMRNLCPTCADSIRGRNDETGLSATVTAMEDEVSGLLDQLRMATATATHYEAEAEDWRRMAEQEAANARQATIARNWYRDELDRMRAIAGRAEGTIAAAVEVISDTHPGGSEMAQVYDILDSYTG